jgi:hypothetical protein
MKAEITYTQDRRYKKGVRVEVAVRDDGALVYALDVHGRHSQREASMIGRGIGMRYESFSEDWGTIEVSDMPPAIETIGD